MLRHAVTRRVLRLTVLAGCVMLLGQPPSWAKWPWQSPAPAPTASSPVASLKSEAFQRATAYAPQLKGMTLVFHDEFESDSIDRQTWATLYPDGRRTNAANEEAQWYVDNALEQRDGTLTLIGEPAWPSDKHGMPYRSGMISSYPSFQFQYGYMEARLKHPKGKGLWGAFWTLPVTKAWPPEIDVMEMIGSDPYSVHFTNHFQTAPDTYEKVRSVYGSTDLTQDFHTYACLWEPDRLTWFVDGQVQGIHTVRVPQEAMYLIANLALGGKWPGYPDESTSFPARFILDYVRVYQN